MIEEEYILLGKSSYAIAVITDILKLNHNTLDLALISNIDNSENDSLLYDYAISDINIKEYNIADIGSIKHKKLIIASIGRSRKKIHEYFGKLIDYSINNFIQVVHPSSIIGSQVSCGTGVHISPLSVVAPFARLGNFVVINRNSSIGHHSILGDFVTVNPGVNISGIVEIGDNSIIGAGCTIFDKVKIGKNTIIGAASLVTKDVPDNVVVFGSPAKIIKENNA